MRAGGLVDDKLVAPILDALLRYFGRGLMNPVPLTKALLEAVEPLRRLMSVVAPIDREGEVRNLWLRVPSGTIEDYDSFEDMRSWGEVETYEGYEARWHEDYPEEFSWYRLVVTESFEANGKLRYVGVSLGNRTIVSALADERLSDMRHAYYAEDVACSICSLILPAVRKSIELLSTGEYNCLVAASLPYQFRTGIIKRRDLWEVEPDVRTSDFDGLSEESVREFRRLVRSGTNNADRIGRIREFTANDFFHACRVGYESIGKDCGGLDLSELYVHYADGRDEGLTGEGHGLNVGSGIDFDDPKAWEEWYFHRTQHGGHPWEVVPGGNSTHVELCVRHDRWDLEWKFKSGMILEGEYEQGLKDAGYYFAIAGRHRQFEAVSFYLAMSRAGLPVVIEDAEQLLARFEGTDWVGVVPHHVLTRYCEGLFPDEYGDIIDFTHVYKGEDAWFDRIVWLPEEETTLSERAAEGGQCPI